MDPSPGHFPVVTCIVHLNVELFILPHQLNRWKNRWSENYDSITLTSLIHVNTTYKKVNTFQWSS